MYPLTTRYSATSTAPAAAPMRVLWLTTMYFTPFGSTVLADATDRGRHAPAVVAVETGLRTIGIVVDLDPLSRRRGQPELASLVADGGEDVLHVGNRRRPAERGEDGFGMGLEHVHARARGADLGRVLREDLATFQLDLLFFSGNEGDEVVQDIEAHDTR